MNLNVKHYIETKKGHAFAHLQEQFWLEIINESLSMTNGNATKASQILGINKATFWNWCNRLGVDYKTHQVGLIGDVQRQEFIELLRNSKSITDAALKVDRHHRTIARRMKELNISHEIIGKDLC